jgi:hypothetical protein
MIGKIGIGIIVLTFVLSAMSPYVLMFTIPVFAIGVLLVWFSKRKILAKVLWTVLPVLLWYPAFGTFMYLSGTIGTATAQKFDFIFPNGFKGDVILVGNISCGQPVQKKDGREQLFIPSNGILLYQGEVKTGYVNHKYYYQLDDGKLQSLPDRANYMYFDSEKNPPPTNVVGVWLGGTGSTTNSETEPTIEYSSMTLTVDSKDSISLHYDFQKEKRFQSMTDSLIRDCEKKRLNSKQKQL